MLLWSMYSKQIVCKKWLKIWMFGSLASWDVKICKIYESKFDSVEQACFTVVFGLVWCDMILFRDHSSEIGKPYPWMLVNGSSEKVLSAFCIKPAFHHLTCPKNYCNNGTVRVPRIKMEIHKPEIIDIRQTSSLCCSAVEVGMVNRLVGSADSDKDWQSGFSRLGIT